MILYAEQINQTFELSIMAAFDGYFIFYILTLAAVGNHHL